MRHLLKLAQLPVKLEVQGKGVLLIPKMSLGEVMEWAQEVKSKWEEERTAGMDPHNRREYLTFYPTTPPSIRALRMILETPEGVDRVLRPKLLSAVTESGESGLTALEVEMMLSGNGLSVLTNLAREIADLEDEGSSNTTAATPVGGSEKDPLKSPGKGAS